MSNSGHKDFSPPNEYFSAFFKTKKITSDFQALCYSNVYQSCKMLYFSARNLCNRAKCYILVQEICGCDSNSAYTTLPSAAGMPLFMFLGKQMKKIIALPWLPPEAPSGAF